MAGNHQTEQTEQSTPPDKLSAFLNFRYWKVCTLTWFFFILGVRRLKVTFYIYSSLCCSVAQSCLTLWDPVDYSSPDFPVLHHLPEFAHTHVHWVGDPSSHLILCHTLLLPSSVFPSMGVFSNELALLHIRWPKYWGFSSASVLPMNIQAWFPSGLTGLISLLSKALSRAFSSLGLYNNIFCFVSFNICFLSSESYFYRLNGHVSLV